MPALTAIFSLEGDAIPSDASTAHFEAHEAISEPYSISVTFATRDTSFRAEDCLRTRLCLVVTSALGLPRYFDGVVDRARFVRVVDDERHFEMRLRPALAGLEHRQGCRIFQEKTIVQIVQTFFEEAGFGDKVTWQITKEYEPREFVVQYNETHLNFVSRLLEHNGIYYFFRHSAEGHQLILGDDPSAFEADGPVPVVFGLAQGIGLPGVEPLKHFSRSRALRNNSVHLRDYDFERPGTCPEAQQPAKEAHQLPYFEYPAGFVKSAVGQRLAEARLRSLRRDADTCEGESHAVGMIVGAPFLVEGAGQPCLLGEFVSTRLVSQGKQTRMGGNTNTMLENKFSGIPKGVPYAPAIRAKKPRIHGIQTAVVTGSSKQEQTIHVDKYGRIKVRFYWDRVGQQDHTSSCWIRMAQSEMGSSISLPRVGWEVSVAFLDGDPDRPVAMGRVYNAEKTPPYALPGEKTTGALKSMSSPGAGGYNEIKMGDSAGGQGLSIHAQKDLNVVVQNDKIEETGVNEDQKIAVNGIRTVKVNDDTQVGANQSINIGAVRSQNIGGNQSITVSGNETSNSTANFVEKIDVNRTYNVGGNWITICNGLTESVTGNFKRTTGSVELQGTIGSINDTIVSSYDETIGAIKIQLVNGSHGEKVAADKSETYMVGELHYTKAGMDCEAGGAVTNMVGGLHYRKLGGDFTVKSPMITLLGGIGTFNGGGSQLKLGGGPVHITTPKLQVKSALVVKMSASMKLG
ncbi:MAG TPA: type VI secretion system tip protein TssI/VgrG [Polyangium sp.]|nr:type VI secretion system tip protein TssI/VgrG [Polyangium sp.]